MDQTAISEGYVDKGPNFRWKQLIYCFLSACFIKLCFNIFCSESMRALSTRRLC